MMTDAKYAVTLTGKIQAGKDAPAVWQRVEHLLKLDPDAFRERVLARVPITLKAVDREEAVRQHKAVLACGADAQLHAEDGQPRLWLRIEHSTRGPVSRSYVRGALRSGDLEADLQACTEGGHDWQPLSALVRMEAGSGPGAPDEMRPWPGVSAPASVPDSSPTPAARTRELPSHRNASGLYAGFWMRVAAYFLDVLILLIPTAIIEAMAGFTLTTTNAGRFLLGRLLVLAMMALYFAVFESSRMQATPGKLALGLVVTDTCGRRIGFGRALGRFFGKIVSNLTLLIGYMMAGWTRRKQALHDLMAGALVVRKDGLRILEDGGELGPASTGLPGWAIALIVIVAAIVPVSILAAIAIPAYQGYIVRAQVMEGVILARDPEQLVAQYVNHNSILPADNATLGMPAPERVHGRYADAVEVDNGEIRVHFGSAASPVLRGGRLVFSPSVNHGVVVWSCASPDLKPRYLPRECR